jgi:hypothetical protein
LQLKIPDFCRGCDIVAIGGATVIETIARLPLFPLDTHGNVFARTADVETVRNRGYLALLQD